MNNFEKEMSCCSPMPEPTSALMPKDTIKEVVGSNYKAACEIAYVLGAIGSEVFGMDMNKVDNPGENTLEAALMGTNKILNSIRDWLHQFANRMGVET